MIGGNTRVNKDVPPYFLYSGFDVTPIGVNIIGLKRAGLSTPEIRPLKTAFRLLFKSRLAVGEALSRLETEASGPHVERLIEFVRSSTRGICRRN